MTEVPAYFLSSLFVHAAAAAGQPVHHPEGIGAQPPTCCAVRVFDAVSFDSLAPSTEIAGAHDSSSGDLLTSETDLPPPPAAGTLGTSDRAAAVVAEETAQLGLAPDASHRYDTGVFSQQAKSIPWRFAGATAAITATGFANWDWGSSSFRFKSEGWFGKGTASLGMDKLGHAYSAYVLSEFFADGIEQGHPRHRALTGAILSMGLMTYIEIFDGFSADHGFSHEDLIVDAAGTAFSVVRRSVPGLREKVDFRLLYVPSKSTWDALSCFPKPHCDKNGATARSPITDYVGQRYLLALKLSGFERLKRTPLRLVELHGGYYARGFTKEEEDRGEPLRRRLFVGIGLNVSELLFAGRPRGNVGRAAKSVLQYLQVPYTAVHSH